MLAGTGMIGFPLSFCKEGNIQTGVDHANHATTQQQPKALEAAIIKLDGFLIAARAVNLVNKADAESSNMIANDCMTKKCIAPLSFKRMP